LKDLFPAKGQELSGQGGRLLAGFADQFRVLFRERIAAGPRRDQFRVADDRGEQVVEIVGHATGQPAHRFHLLRMPQLFLALAQRFLGRASLLHFAHEIVALLEEFLRRPRHLSEFRMVVA
jgi:hypothetical protein